MDGFCHFYNGSMPRVSPIRTEPITEPFPLLEVRDGTGEILLQLDDEGRVYYGPSYTPEKFKRFSDAVRQKLVTTEL